MRFIGCKTGLLEQIEMVITKHAQQTGVFCDIFSGTSTVARHFKSQYSIISNDLLYFSYCLQKATIENNSVPKFDLLKPVIGCEPIDYLNNLDSAAMEKLPQCKRLFQNTYSPFAGRMYFTDENALRIDFSRHAIESWQEAGLISELEYYYLVACVVEGVPFVSNISGTYGAYNKKWDRRSYKKFELFKLPVVTNSSVNHCYNEDGVELLKKITGDILYIDPPYNERQYLPNYHVLETAAKYDFPEISGVTGQRKYEGQKSLFCSKAKVLEAFENLIENASFRHIILSYNTEGLMRLDDIKRIMQRHCQPNTFEVHAVPYRRFKSRTTAFAESLKELIIYIRK